MNRFVAFLLLVGIIAGGWYLFTSAGFIAFLAGVPKVFWLVLAIVAWLCLVVLGYTIDPYLGELIFRVGLWLIVIWFDKDAKINMPERGGAGSGRTGRTN